VAHDDQVGIIAHHHDGVLERLSFGGAAGGRIREADDAPTQPVDSSLETEARAGRGLEEEGGADPSFQQITVGILFESGCGLQYAQDILPTVIADIYQAFGTHGDIFIL